MAIQRATIPERFILHAVLVVGAICFAFPFLWMLSTSFKIRRELISDNLRVLPLAPHPQATSPYIDSTEFRKPGMPDGIPAPVWNAALPQLEKLLGEMAMQWHPAMIAPEGDPAPAPVEPKTYQSEMTEGLIRTLSTRISDSARQKAYEVESALRAKKGEKAGALYARDLSAEAIGAGVSAILGEARQLVDEKILRETFDACYRRFCVGEVRVRTRDYKMHSIYSGGEWRLRDDSAEIIPRTERTIKCQEVRYGLGPSHSVISLVFARKLDFNPRDIDRIYVSMRPDASWNRVDFEVVRGADFYRSSPQIVLSDMLWTEQELRWEGDRQDPMARRAYLELKSSGDMVGGGSAPERPHDLADAAIGPSHFEIRMRLSQTSTTGAWIAKLTGNYRQIFREVNLLRYIMTSFSLTIINVILCIFSSTLVAYAFARLEWPGRDLCFGILLATMMIPPQVMMIPGFLVNKQLGWYNTLIPLWIGSAFGSAFFIFLLRQSFKNIPSDLEDAARIDGCGFLRIYWHVMMPLVKPTIAAIAIFTFMGVWNNFMGPLIYVNDERLFPLALGMFKFNLRAGADMALMMSGSFLMTLPIILLFFFVQRYFIQGISLTGVKG